MEVSRASLECNDGIVVLHSNMLLSPIQDDLKARVEDRTTLDLVGGPRKPEGEMQATDVSSRSSALEFRTSPSPHSVLTCWEHPGDSRRTCDTIATPINDQDIPSTPTLVGALCHEALDADELLGDGRDDEKYAVDPTTSASSQTGGCATGSDLDCSGCLISHDRPLRLGTLDAQSKQPPRPAAMVESVKSMHAEHFQIDSRGHEEIAEVRPGDINSSYEGRPIDATAQRVWTKDHDEHLLHLRDVAQLDWQTLVTYYPGIRPIRVKQRYAQLKKNAAADQITDGPSSSQYGRSMTHLPSASCSGIGQVSVAETQPADPAIQTKRATVAPRPAHRRRPQPQVNRVEAAPAHRVTHPRTSRCGRTIRHPFRHRQSEGYL